MLEQGQKKDLETTILKGLCPRCGSLEVKYYELEKNQIFRFKCDECGSQTKYTAGDLEYLSQHYLVGYGNYS